jgi:hypothetical protein
VRLRVAALRYDKFKVAFAKEQGELFALLHHTFCGNCVEQVGLGVAPRRIVATHGVSMAGGFCYFDDHLQWGL